jgi:hypothetical protein
VRYLVTELGADLSALSDAECRVPGLPGRPTYGGPGSLPAVDNFHPERLLLADARSRPAILLPATLVI